MITFRQPHHANRMASASSCDSTGAPVSFPASAMPSRFPGRSTAQPERAAPRRRLYDDRLSLHSRQHAADPAVAPPQRERAPRPLPRRRVLRLDHRQIRLIRELQQPLRVQPGHRRHMHQHRTPIRPAMEQRRRAPIAGIDAENHARPSGLYHCYFPFINSQLHSAHCTTPVIVYYIMYMRVHIYILHIHYDIFSRIG